MYAHMKNLWVIVSCLVVGMLIMTGTVMAQQVPMDSSVSLKSKNYPTHFIRHRGGLGEITTINTDLDRQDSTFRIVSGLADPSLISFESVNYPGHYLRHQDYRIKLHPFDNTDLFRKDATFRPVPGLADANWASFESYNFPGRFIRHRDYHLYIEGGDTDLFRNDATFNFAPPYSN